jgi:deoxyribodipyrimidine photo-lyase
MRPDLIIVWFRQDLRLADNRALTAAATAGAEVLPVYVLDEETPGCWKPGGASRWWLHHSLASLADRLETAGSRLVLRRGSAREVLARLATETGAGAIHCTRAYEPWARQLEDDLRVDLAAHGAELRIFPGALLYEPEEIRNRSGEPFKVFTPFWRTLRARGGPARPLPPPSSLRPARCAVESETLAALGLLPAGPDWAGGLRESWRPGEASAAARLERFVEALAVYPEQRNRPDLPGTSRLSPHLHFGETSPALCWHAACAAVERKGDDAGLETYLKELVWREFSYHLLVHWPELPEQPLRPEFRVFPWRRDPARLAAWQKGRTGYPIVDAGMRELWATGWMHNRVRMIVASFLIKDLLIAWQNGEAWFWDTLVDADLANNAASWQWVAGSGADAAPYFRIFNPVTQGLKFDPEGAYVRRWVPELARLAAPDVHAPWRAPPGVLAAAGVVLGESYPRPIVDHAAARARALAAFETLKVQVAGEANGAAATRPAID